MDEINQNKDFNSIEIFAERPNMSGHIFGPVRKNLLESGEEAIHIRCPKSDSLVCRTGYSGFDRTEKNMEELWEKHEKLREI
jgi:hypothetical protein